MQGLQALKLLELTLYSANPEGQHRFYREVLGLKEHDGSLQAGDSRLRFVAGEVDSPYHFAFNVPPDQFEATRDWIRGRVPLLRDRAGADRFAFDFWDAEASYFLDPDGNIAECIARQERPGPDPSSPSPGDLAPPPSGGGAPTILEVSEIGLVGEDPQQLRAQVQSQLDIPVYRDLFRDDFGALGDAQGLLIMVRAGREWYPETGILARALPLQVTFASGGRQARLTALPYHLQITNVP